MHPWFTETEMATNFFMETPTDLEKCYTATRLSHNTAARVDAGSVASDIGIGHRACHFLDI